MLSNARIRLSVLALLSGLLPAAAIAQELTVYGGGALQYYTKNDDGPSKSDLNAYIELEYNGFYGGIWGEVTDLEAANEINLYLGYRGSSGKISYDLNYYYYIYPETPAGEDYDYGELNLYADYALTDAFAVGVDLYHQPDSKDNAAYLVATWYATDKLTLDASYGRYEYLGERSNEWEFGVGYMVTDEFGVELRYYNGQDYDDSLRLQLSWDTTLFSR